MTDSVREKLIAPLGLHIVDEARHIIRDTYSGLEYRYREALGRILEMAERGEFDVLCMDVLDRGLGRKALARELYRMQLKELGVGVLTTDPSDYADDDSLTGQIMRFHKGIKAEEEVNDLVRRTQNGKREKALGNEARGIPPRIVGVGIRRYGYEYVLNEKGTRVGYKLKLDVVHIEADGSEWTEVAVVVFIFESAANGVSTHQIARILNAKGIPSPYISKGVQFKKMREEPVWQNMSVSRILKDSAYYGEFRYSKTAVLRVPGRKRPLRRKTSEDEQIIIPVPAMVTKELALRANKRVAQNKQLATRNNHTSKESLLRGGFAKCAYCGRSCRVARIIHTSAKGEQVVHFHYDCTKPNLKGGGKCQGCSIPVDELDRAVAEYIVEVIRDPSVVDQKIQQLQAENPAHKQQQKKLKNLNAILREQETFRNNLASEMRKKTLSERTVAFLNTQLTALEQQEQEARKDLADEQRMQQQRDKLQQRIVEFHQQCQEWREKLDDPQFTPSFQFNLDAVLFFGLSVTVWRTGTKPRYDIHTDPPEIVELLS